MATILLAEDDESLRVFLSRALIQAGHRVTAVGDGVEAFAALSAEEYEMLVTDIVMPGMDGIELARRAGALKPQMRILLITGFAAVALRARTLPAQHAKVMSKPFHLRELVDQVNKILAA